MLFGITTECCSPSERNRVRLRPDSPIQYEIMATFGMSTSIDAAAAERFAQALRIIK
jgi:hypothetical protein